MMGLAALGVLGSPVDATVYPCIERAEKVGDVVEYKTYCPPSTTSTTTTVAPATTSTTAPPTTTLVSTTTTAPSPTTTTTSSVVGNLKVEREDDAKVATAVVAKPGFTG